MIGAGSFHFVERFRTATEMLPAHGGGLVEPFVQAVVGVVGGGGQGAGGRRHIEGKGHELIEDLLARMQGRHAGHRGERQRDPAAADLAVAQFKPVVTVAQRHRQIPLRGMAIDRNFLQRVGMSSALAQAGHIGNTQAELTGSHIEGLTSIGFGDLPEDVGPLRIAWQEHHPGQGAGAGSRLEAGFEIRKGGWGSSGFAAGTTGRGGFSEANARGLSRRLARGDFRDQFVFGFAAVQAHTQITGDLAELPERHTSEGI